MTASLEETLVGPVGALPRVNLLPREVGESRRFRRIQYGLGGAVLASAVVVGLLYLSATQSVTSAQNQLDTASARHASLQSQTARYASVNAFYARAAAAQAMLRTAMGQEVRYSQLLADLSTTVPANVWLKTITFTQGAPASGAAPANPTRTATGIGTVSFTGVGRSHNDVAAWLDSLATQKQYADSTFTSSTEALLGTAKVVNFSSTTTLTSGALSGRYTTPAGG